jgi:hypothetical protein
MSFYFDAVVDRSGFASRPTINREEPLFSPSLPPQFVVAIDYIITLALLVVGREK